MASSMQGNACKICSGSTHPVGVKRGNFRARDYHLHRCSSCGFAWVEDPDRDFANLYDEKYYRGEGADPLVSYLDELMDPDTSIRQLEWAGIFEAISSLLPHAIRGNWVQCNWLDYGCGNGGFVRYLRAQHLVNAQGFETGWIADRARKAGIPVESDSTQLTQKYDVITSIEVLEHVEDPIIFLKQVRGLLKPGGIFFLTTGNSQPFSKRLLDWAYVQPEIHISFFNPNALRLAFERAGLRPESRAGYPGFQKIYAFKVLKNLKQKKLTSWHRLIPWSLARHLLEAKFQLERMPFARASLLD